MTLHPDEPTLDAGEHASRVQVYELHGIPWPVDPLELDRAGLYPEGQCPELEEDQ